MSFNHFYRHPLPALIRQIRKIKRNNTPKFYAVAVGRRVGIYRSWPSCKVQIDGIANAKYCKFSDHNDALQYIVDTPKENLIISQKIKPTISHVKRSIVYTDGSCWRNGMDGACAGIGVFWPKFPEKNFSQKLDGKQTSVRAEIYAVITALQQAYEMNIEHLTIYTDSHFIIQTATQWLKKWKDNGWKTYDGSPVKNKDDMLELDMAISRIPNIVWKAVSSHSGVHGNEQADKLANTAIADYLSSLQQQPTDIKDINTS